jgi:hypothetical protein
MAPCSQLSPCETFKLYTRQQHPYQSGTASLVCATRGASISTGAGGLIPCAHTPEQNPLISAIGVDPMTVAGLTFHPYLMFFVASVTVRLLAVLLSWKTV